MCPKSNVFQDQIEPYETLSLKPYTGLGVEFSWQSACLAQMQPQVPSPPLYKGDMVVHTGNLRNPEVEGGGIQGHLSHISEFDIQDHDSKSQDILVPYTSKWQLTLAKGQDRQNKSHILFTSERATSCMIPNLDARSRWC